MSHKGEEGSAESVCEDVDTASRVAAGTVGSCFASVVTESGKDTVSVIKEASAVVGEVATKKRCERGARTPLADSEYSVTP